LISDCDIPKFVFTGFNEISGLDISVLDSLSEFNSSVDVEF